MNITPAMAQYYELKEQHKDAILFFRMGDFYEMFAEDAQVAHSILGIALTTRNKNAENPVPLAGIPYHAKEKYLSQLIDAGYKVAIAEQVSDPKLKGIVKREVVRVVTPATLNLESEKYDNKEVSNVILSLCFEKDIYGMAVLDLSNNTFFCSQFQNFHSLCEQVYKLNPSEVILEKTLFQDIQLKEILEKKYALNIYFFNSTVSSQTHLLDFFNVQSLDSFGISEKIQCQAAASQLIEYLQEHQKSDLDFITSLSYESFSGFMDIDESTIRSLDLVYNFATQSQKLGTLLGVLDSTQTSMGKRFLRQQILHPLQDLKEIKARQNFIREFVENRELLDGVQDQLKYVADIDAILNRLSLNRAGIKDMIHLKRSLQAIIEVKEIVESHGNTSLKKIFT